MCARAHQLDLGRRVRDRELSTQVSNDWVVVRCTQQLELRDQLSKELQLTEQLQQLDLMLLNAVGSQIETLNVMSHLQTQLAGQSQVPVH